MAIMCLAISIPLILYHYICDVGKRTQPYRLGFPERYFTQGDDSAGSDETHARKMRTRKKAYEEGKKIDLKR